MERIEFNVPVVTANYIEIVYIEWCVKAPSVVEDEGDEEHYFPSKEQALAFAQKTNVNGLTAKPFQCIRHMVRA